MASKVRNHTLLSSAFFLLFFGISQSQKDKLLQGELLKDGEQLVSAFGNFTLGFFSPPSTTNRYLGIRYRSPVDRTSRRSWGEEEDNYYGVDDPVWIANRNIPVLDNSGRLAIDTSDGNLKIFQDIGSPIAVSYVQNASNTSATLLSTGNLVLHETSSDGTIGRILWESFDYPTDTLLPGMKLGINFQTGHKRFLQSWITVDSPAQGSYTLGLDENGTNLQLITWWLGKVYWSSGQWRNGRFNFSEVWSISYYNFSFTSNEHEKYFSYSLHGANVKSFPKLTINRDGELIDERGALISCPVFGGCVYQNFASCYSSGVQPTLRYKVGFISGDEFKVKGGDNMTELDCYTNCLNYCSCVAYAVTNRNNNTGCRIWSRVAKFTPDFSYQSLGIVFLQFKEHKRPPWLIIAVVGALLLLLCSLSFLRRRKYDAEEKCWLSLIFAIGVALVIPPLCYSFYITWRKLKAKVQSMRNRRKLLRELGENVSVPTICGEEDTKDKHQIMKHELKIFDFQTIANATNNFSTTNKLGEGGFGPVYKGKLIDGQQEIAVKRLSRNSGQGVIEFKNEAKLIAKLQHTNLVRLLGCSLQGDERLLVYEYMPNKSLDFFIFNSERKKLLNWKIRLNIIEGIAQGLLYLHKYSRLTVIHRDLKASNILLDERMDPKISDFGMARIFGVNQSEANTKRIVGTYGYMSPEYAMSGIVSIKTDVFSFGVLVLEIVSGKRNHACHHPDQPLNLIGYAWQLLNEGKTLVLMDPSLEESYSVNEVLRCIHVALLCVQDQAMDRPTMLDVAFMLKNEAMPLPSPKQPAFFINVNAEQDPEVPENKVEDCSTNDVTISTMEAR